MNMNILKKSGVALLSIAMLTGTLSGCASRSVSRVDTNEEIALSDKWNDKDSQLVSTEMITDMLSFPWLRDFSADNSGKRPAIIIQKVRNKSHEHIATDTFVNDVKRAIMRSGKADFVAGGEERNDLRAERRDQELNSSGNTAKQMGNEQGADFALSGTINSIVDQYEGDRVTFYQVDLKLINMETNREAWNGQKKIKKLQEKKTFGF
jgi:uncharacterized protein (TIGR02722 family)